MDKVSERLWVPFQAALEYQRNRPLVVAEQKKRFSQVRQVVDTTYSGLTAGLEQLQLQKRHSSIDPAEFLQKIDSLMQEFKGKLQSLEEVQSSVSEEESLRSRIDSLLAKKIGSPPESQSAIDTIYEEGKKRFAAQIPPGYLDSNKSKEQGASYAYGGLIYKAEYGDLLVWKQLVLAAKAREMKYVILLTDDSKEDWWWSVDSGGKSTLGPRPELVEEIRREAGVEQFHMYRSEQFLMFAREYLKASVSSESINQVRDVASTTTRRIVVSEPTFVESERSVVEWLQKSFPEDVVEHSRQAFPDITVTMKDTGATVGFEVLTVYSLQTQPNVQRRIREIVARAQQEKHLGRLDSVNIVLGLRRPHGEEEIRNFIERQVNVPGWIGIVVGRLVWVRKKDGTISSRFSVVSRREPMAQEEAL